MPKVAKKAIKKEAKTPMKKKIAKKAVKKSNDFVAFNSKIEKKAMTKIEKVCKKNKMTKTEFFREAIHAHLK